MGLAMPMAIWSQRWPLGILFRRGASPDTRSRVDQAVLLKTGTLAGGRPSLMDFRNSGVFETAAPALAAAGEATGRLGHPWPPT